MTERWTREAEAARAAERSRRIAPVAGRLRRSIDTMLLDEDIYDELREDLRTRLDHEGFEPEFAGVPYEQVIRTIHHDLGIPEPEFGPEDRVPALIWNAQWGDRRSPGPEAPPGDPPPDPDIRHASG